MIDITELTLDEFKADIMKQVAESKPPKHFGWTWVVAAMQKHDPCQFWWTTKATFETMDEAQQHMQQLQSKIQFPFKRKPRFIDDTKGIIF